MDEKSTERWKLIDALLDHFLDLPPEDRTAYLDDQRQQARQALFDLYTAWGKPEQAAPFNGGSPQ